jgi:hypothetical protein
LPPPWLLQGSCGQQGTKRKPGQRILDCWIPRVTVTRLSTAVLAALDLLGQVILDSGSSTSHIPVCPSWMGQFSCVLTPAPAPLSWSRAFLHQSSFLITLLLLSSLVLSAVTHTSTMAAPGPELVLHKIISSTTSAHFPTPRHAILWKNIWGSQMLEFDLSLPLILCVCLCLVCIYLINRISIPEN